MKYVYRGPMPDVDADGEIVRPGDVREFGAPPDCPPWQPIKEAGQGAAGSDPAPAAEDESGSAAPVPALSVPPTAPVTGPKGN